VIALLAASRRVVSANGPREILSPTTLMIHDRARVGILAARGSGKSVIARLLAGIDPPDEGEVLRQGRVSWPIGFAGGLHPDLTVAENIALIAGLLGEDAGELTAFCDLVGGLGALLGLPMKRATPAERSVLGCCLSLGVACDTYIADDTIGFGLNRQRAKSEMLLTQRLETAGLVFLSSNPQQIGRFCDQFYVLLAGRLLPCEDLRAGQQSLEAMSCPAEGDADDRE
jgi:capsular polysaccharide transport system ATP-binding protein